MKKSMRNMWRLYQWIRKISPSYLPLTMLEEGIRALRPFLSMYLLARIIDGMMEGKTEAELIKPALCLVLFNMLLALVQWGIDKVLIIRRRLVEDGMEAAMAQKSLTMDYQILEEAKTQERIARIEDGRNYSGGISNYCGTVSHLFRAWITAGYTLFLLMPLLFSKEGGAGHIMAGIGMVLLFGMLARYEFVLAKRNREVQNKAFQHGTKNNRRFGYFMNYLYDYQQGKGVRIFNMLPMIQGKMKELAERMTEIWLGEVKAFHGLFIRERAAFLLVKVISYGYVGGKVMSGMISVGELTMYIGIITSLYDAFETISGMTSWAAMVSGYLLEYVNYLEVPNEKYEGTLPVEKRLDHEYELEFRDVSFHYPNSSEQVLRHVSAKIHVGRKMAIVGRNGSGKSTFIKLLCRLYDPTEGEILLNGIDIRKYDYDEYRRLFGVVFQDFQLFSFSVAQNVAANVEYEEEKVLDSLRQAGLKQRVEEMEQGIETVIFKQGEEGVEISGGEAQKLAIARALYRDAPVVILDEPTAALDPVSELEIYERFDEMVEEKTAIYISHRMSSCRFCENIVVFDQGKIVQMGSHDSLLGEKGGLYGKLWEAQAQYYQG